MRHVSVGVRRDLGGRTRGRAAATLEHERRRRRRSEEVALRVRRLDPRASASSAIHVRVRVASRSGAGRLDGHDLAAFERRERDRPERRDNRDHEASARPASMRVAARRWPAALVHAREERSHVERRVVRLAAELAVRALDLEDDPLGLRPRRVRPRSIRFAASTTSPSSNASASPRT
jgi:hypothetical protein